VPLLRRLALLLAVEGLALVALGIGSGIASLSDRGDRTPVELAAGAAVVTGLVLLTLARATDAGRAWARAPSVTLNVFPFPVAVGVFQAGAWWAATPMIVLAGSVLYLFATPELRALFRAGA
jgi:hypothetical protein